MNIPGQRVIGEYNLIMNTLNKAINIPMLNQEWSSNVINLIEEPILITDESGRIILVNDAFIKLRGLEEKEILLGRYVQDFNPPSKICDVLESKKPFTGISHRDSSTFYIVEIKPILQEDTLLGAILFAKNISNIVKFYGDILDPLGERDTKKDNEIITQDINLLGLINKAKRSSKTDLTVLITGESGTGKELFARLIHEHSLRADRPFVAINCSALSASLIDSELFGYDDGAFTGSRKGGKIGLFEAANGGTLFLDEIGDMPLELQPKLLRVIEQKSIRKIGSTSSKPIDVRLIAATNKQLEEMRDAKTFRKDLFYRLCSINLDIPPLRERKGDIELLVHRIMKEIKQEKNINISITNEAISTLRDYKWPGNVRELKNLILNLSFTSEDGIIKKADFPDYILKGQSFRAVDPIFNQITEFEYRKKVLLNYLKEETEITNKEYCKLMTVSRNTAYRDLLRLVSKGLLTRIGKGRSTKYIYGNKLE